MLSSPGETLDVLGAGCTSFGHLIVVEPESSRRVELAALGELVIGRDPSCEVRLEHRSVSRRHARLVIDTSGVQVADEGSHNGTRVNGEPVDAPRALATGDTIAVGEVVLIVHVGARRPLPRTVVSEAMLRARAAEEVERALTHGRPVAFVVLVGLVGDHAADAVATITTELRGMDVAGFGDDGALLLLMPELDADAAQRAAVRLLRRRGDACASARAGVTACPTDACDADALLLAARQAAQAAAPGRVAAGRDAATELDLDGRRVILAAVTMQRVYELIKRLAASELPVLVSGETGVGKENAAFAVHWFSTRRGAAFLPINCAAIPETLVESILFGHERGAFSGAATAKPGLLESAAGGTVFLDEIGELPLLVQAKLLRALDQRAVTRLGDTRERPIDVRVVAATNRELEAEVQAGRFRQDLFFRLGATVLLPPLRDRRIEIPLLAHELLTQACTNLRRAPMGIAPAAMQALVTYDWPGNVRDLRMVMDVVAATVDDDRLELEDLPERITGTSPVAPEPVMPPAPSSDATAFRPIAEELDDLLQQRMLAALAASGGVRTRAAALLSMPIRTFTYKMRQFGLKG